MSKSIRVLSVFIFLSITTYAQENLVTLSGGYAFANIQDFDENMTGWRISGLYEFNAFQGKFASGISFGYISTKLTVDNQGIIGGTTDYKINSWPIYYAPKFIFGGDSFKGFVKGALGMHFSNFKKTGPVFPVESTDFGFYGGLGAGVMLYLGEMIFINLEYEWAFMGNSYYRNGFVNSIMFGVGVKF
jgi:hypothetical protein